MSVEDASYVHIYTYPAVRGAQFARNKDVCERISKYESAEWYSYSSANVTITGRASLPWPKENGARSRACAANGPETEAR